MLYKFQKGGVMHLKEQLYICTIAECGNITKAAEKLFITQPALSLYINNPCRWGVAHWCPTPESTASSPHSHGPF